VQTAEGGANGRKETLNRLEVVGRTGRCHKIGYSADALDRLLGDLFLETHTSAPEQIVLDLDATGIPLYCHQPQRFLRRCFGSYCYLPLNIFAQTGTTVDRPDGRAG
jgi:hypothetical protein